MATADRHIILDQLYCK